MLMVFIYEYKITLFILNLTPTGMTNDDDARSAAKLWKEKQSTC